MLIILNYILVPRPDHDRFVFLQSQENLRGILVDDMSLDGRYFCFLLIHYRYLKLKLN